MAITKKMSEVIRAAARVEFELTKLHAALKAVAIEPRANAKKLTADEVNRIRSLHKAQTMNQRDIAEAFDVNPATISRIVRGVYHGGR